MTTAADSVATEQRANAAPVLDVERAYGPIDRLMASAREVANLLGDDTKAILGFYEFVLMVVAPQAGNPELEHMAGLCARIRDYWMASLRSDSSGADMQSAIYGELVDELTGLRGRMIELLEPWLASVTAHLFRLRLDGIVEFGIPAQYRSEDLPAGETEVANIMPTPRILPGPHYRPGWWHEGAVLPS